VGTGVGAGVGTGVGVLEVKMTPKHWDNQQKSWQQRDERLQQHRGKVFSLMMGQCTQSLKEKLK
jgi:hypothetical protein